MSVETRNAEGLLDFEPDEVERELRRLGEDYAQANAGANLLEHLRKVLLAKLANGAPDDYRSESARERWAHAHPDYEEHVNQMVEARAAADTARARLVSYQEWVGLKRTAAATERAMMNIR